MATDYPTLAFEDEASFEHWLDRNHAASSGIWIRFGKKNAGIPSVTYTEAVETALCFGWIDGQARSLDEKTFLQKFTPRRKGSVWSKINCNRAEVLIGAGRMRPAGFAAIEDAKANGRWDAAYSVSAEHPEWEAALAQNKRAQKAWSKLDSRNRAGILFRIQTVRRSETRARKIAEFVDMLARGEKLFP